MRTTLMSTFLIAALSVPTLASAQEDISTQPASSAGPTTTASGGKKDGPRFRFGINAAGGIESVAGLSGPFFGADMRLGLQLNDLFAIYAQPHLSFGDFGGLFGFSGTFAATVLGEVTLADRFFAGAGVGYGVLNNPSGFAFNARAGAYPIMSHDEDGVGRDGLMVGVDLKTIFVSGGTGVMFMGTIGYEGF